MNEYNCDYNGCVKRYDKLSELNRHKRLVHKKRYKCDYKQCGKLLATKWHLQRHRRKHNQDIQKGEKCGYCDEVMIDKATLRKHIKLQHQLCEKEYVCRKCRKRYSTKHALQSHVVTHLKREQRKLHKCDQCNIQCTTHSNLKRHSAKYH